MAGFWEIAAPILVLDVVNPVLLAAVILAMTTDRPHACALVVIAGHTTAYIFSGLLLVYGIAETAARLLEPVIAGIQNPQPGDFVISLVVGVLLIWVALRWKVNPPKPSEDPPAPPNPTLISAFFFGAMINIVGIPFAVPYFAFVNLLMREGSSFLLGNLLIYNVLYALPFLMVPASVALFGQSAMPVLQNISKAVDKHSAYLMPVLLALAGLALVADAVLYFATGSGFI